jgi:hypothetical protein
VFFLAYLPDIPQFPDSRSLAETAPTSRAGQLIFDASRVQTLLSSVTLLIFFGTKRPPDMDRDIEVKTEHTNLTNRTMVTVQSTKDSMSDLSKLDDEVIILLPVVRFFFSDVSNCRSRCLSLAGR